MVASLVAVMTIMEGYPRLTHDPPLNVVAVVMLEATRTLGGHRNTTKKGALAGKKVSKDFFKKVPLGRKRRQRKLRSITRAG